VRGALEAAAGLAGLAATLALAFWVLSFAAYPRADTGVPAGPAHADLP
jgi:hypothetical protein